VLSGKTQSNGNTDHKNGEIETDYAITEGWDDEDAQEVRNASGCPEDASARRKWALQEENRAKWEWEAGRIYGADFFNPYLDFNTFSLKLPGFTLGVLPFLDGKDQLR
jgi:Protein of unknown function (DUF1769)